MKILIAEDDPELARQTQDWLREAGHETVWVKAGYEALSRGHEVAFDLILLDIGLPELDGFQIIEQLRGDAVRTPVICLTARDTVMDRVHGLKVGADDYLTKPFAEPELLARIEALHRRATHGLAAVSAKSGWKLDPVRRRVQVGTMVADLQPREWLLLELLMTNDGRVLTKKFLLDKVWGIQYTPGTNVVDVLVCRLRSKLDPTDGPSFIETVRGKGYVFRANP
ncbi:MAG: response regulator transcription factor [Verrucomicrobiaceae bacterium]|nr:response regulator transcription factor [Verrucomicrobiaceae bacterium]